MLRQRPHLLLKQAPWRRGLGDVAGVGTPSSKPPSDHAIISGQKLAEFMRDNGSAMTAAGIVIAGVGWVISKISRLENQLNAERDLTQKDVQLAEARASQQIAESQARLQENLLRYLATEDYKPLQAALANKGQNKGQK
eukprot:TRINITY_DN6073_c0_g1_i1.p1 TRINITY_DN6073_c0_g1~~TRINITY_DN6073_c0_g1_i1.p1  ORF type:complete len:139 (-),score=23.09 TRINITY_DN6073_c0_g1_i1:366-782(-)